MPLIRYRMDDYTGYVGETCECGRHTPIIFPIDSRANDLVITPTGIIIPPGVFTYPMLQAQHVAEAQIVQRSLDEVVIKVVPADDFSGQDELSIIDAFETCLEGTMTVRVERVTKIHQTGSLKKRWIVNELPGDLFERAMSKERNT
jgi:phenylacetate-CoA ligase